MATRQILCGILCAVLLTGCVNSHPKTTLPLDDKLPYLPLTQGAVIEKACTHYPITIQTTYLLGSLAPDVATAAERVPEIIKRGRIIVGVDQSQNLLSFRNTATGELQGFEVDLAREIARDIFNDPHKVEFRYVDSANWIEALEAKQIDLAMRTAYITRERQDQVFFSTPYFTGSTRMLVANHSPIKEISNLAEETICVTNNSTGAEQARAQAPESDLLVVRSSADCLIALQQNRAAAVVTDDVILSGMAAQDPFTSIVGRPLSMEQYGIAVAKPGVRHNTEGLIRQVNSTLERVFADGTWQRTYNHWLGIYLPHQNPPATNYRDEPNEAEKP